MSDNASKMTIQERLAQRVKESPIGMLIEEDDLTEMAARALTEAFFSDNVVKDRYGHVERRTEAAAITIAREVFTDVMKQRITKIVDDLTKTPAFNEAFGAALSKAMVDILPAVMAGHARQIVVNAVVKSAEHSSHELHETLRTIITNYQPQTWLAAKPFVPDDQKLPD